MIGHAAPPPWWATPVPAWAAVAAFAAVWVSALIWGWLEDQYEVTPRGTRLRVTRRWYGTSAHVRSPGQETRYLVVGWDGNTGFPWLLVQDLGGGETGPFWAPVTGFAPYTVRVFRPHVLRYAGRRHLELFDYRPPRRPSGYRNEASL